MDKSLYILINGMMTVRCDGFFLQAIQPNEFINSVEWKCHQYGQTFSTHQVTLCSWGANMSKKIVRASSVDFHT